MMFAHHALYDSMMFAKLFENWFSQKILEF